MVNPLLDLSYEGSWQELEGINRVIVPFIACGDLSAYDSDMTYPLQVSLRYFIFILINIWHVFPHFFSSNYSWVMFIY